MYKIAIFFRKTAHPNIFRKLILNALKADFDKYLICTAFFQEPSYIGGSFSTSQEIISALNQSPLNLRKNIDFFGIYNHYGKNHMIYFVSI